MIVATTVWLSIALCPARTPPQPDIVARFESVVSRTSDGLLPFRLYCPVKEFRKPQPLLVWLHGLGEAGDNNRDQLAWLELLFERQPDHCPPCYIVALQRPADAPSWLSESAPESHPLKLVNQVIDEVLSRYPIDTRRIYLAGISSGASGCWELAKRYPDRFAAVVPMASTVVDEAQLDRLIELPIWAFQSTGDGPASVQQMRELIRQIQQIGGRAHLTVVNQPSHDCWTYAFVRKDIGNWMLAQKSGLALAPAPGWTVLQFRGAMYAVIALTALATTRIWHQWSPRRGFRKMTNPSFLVDLTSSILYDASKRFLGGKKTRRNAMAAEPDEQGDRIELTPDEARMVIKAIEEVEREEAEALDLSTDDGE